MNRGLYIGKSGMLSFQEKMDTISNNMANVQTAGYKKLTNSFQDLLRDEVGMLGTPLTDEIEERNPTLGTGVKISSTYRVFTQGALLDSANPIECAINGNGFFGYTNADGELQLSRAANLRIQIGTGRLIDEQGNVLMVEGNTNFTNYDVKQISIAKDGSISVDTGSGQMMDAGRVIMYHVPNKDVLIDPGKGYFTASEGAGVVSSVDPGADPNVFGVMRQGIYEGSNANIGEEMVDLMVTQRGYQLSLKAVQTADEMWSQTNQLIRR